MTMNGMALNVIQACIPQSQRSKYEYDEDCCERVICLPTSIIPRPFLGVHQAHLCGEYCLETSTNCFDLSFRL